MPRDGDRRERVKMATRRSEVAGSECGLPLKGSEQKNNKGKRLTHTLEWGIVSYTVIPALRRQRQAELLNSRLVFYPQLQVTRGTQ